jgi:hypothetical protein
VSKVISALAVFLGASHGLAELTDDQRDAWREIAADARSEYDRLRDALRSAEQRELEALAELDNTRARIAELELALRKYGAHKGGRLCFRDRCVCGLDDTLAGKAGDK